MKIKSFGLSDVGQKRPHNEDCFLENHSLGLFVVADGMGGHKAGEVASQIAVDVISAEVHKHRKLMDTYNHGPTQNLKRQILSKLEDAVIAACQAIYRTAEQDESKRGMGTTLSAMVIVAQSAFIAHVGDSRIYMIRDERIHQITEDHTLINEQLKKGLITEDEVENLSQYKNVITRGVGLLKSVEVDTLHIEIAPADRFLLCSDGLHEYLSHREILEMFNQQNLEDLTQDLIRMANDRGGKDNITAITVEIPDLPLSEGSIEVNHKLKTLRQIPMFEKLSYSELVKALNITQIESRPKGDIIIRQGDMGDRMYIIVQGTVDVMNDNVYLNTLERGGHFGEMSLLDNNPRCATVRASTDCNLLIIERNDFYHLMQEEPHLSVKILMSFVGVLSNRLRQTTSAFSEWRKQITEITINS